jgi:hypothetical protein
MAGMLDDSVLDHVACPHTSTAALARSLSGAMQSPAVHAAEQKPKRRSREEMPPLKNERLIKAYHRLRNSWQYEATGKVATAAVLSHLKAQRITYGGPEGIKEQGMALIRCVEQECTAAATGSPPLCTHGRCRQLSAAGQKRAACDLPSTTMCVSWLCSSQKVQQLLPIAQARAAYAARAQSSSPGPARPTQGHLPCMHGSHMLHLPPPSTSHTQAATVHVQPCNPT